MIYSQINQNQTKSNERKAPILIFYIEKKNCILICQASKNAGFRGKKKKKNGRRLKCEKNIRTLFPFLLEMNIVYVILSKKRMTQTKVKLKFYDKQENVYKTNMYQKKKKKK